MARLRTNVLHWGNKYDGPDDYKNGRRGALDDAFWDEDEPVDFPKSSRKTKPKKKPGCPGNDGKAHVYVWVKQSYTLWSGKVWEYEVKTCCGCGKSPRRRATRSIN